MRSSRVGVSRLRKPGGRWISLVAAVSVGTLSLAFPAGSMADTTIGFDDLSTGTVVTNQYAAEGVTLGSAADFGQPSPGGGDCGSPQVASRGITPYSPPNFAQLTTCSAPPGAVPEYVAGTYGALSAVQGYVSVEVQATPATGSVAMTLNGYSSSGTLVVSGTATAMSGAWTLLKAAQTSGSAAISYFEITSAPSTNSSLGVVIDDLAYGAGSTGGSGGGGSGGGGSGGGGSGGGGSGGGGSGGGGSGGGGSGGAASAVVQLVTPVPTAGQPLTVSAGGSSGGSGHIISYDWDFNGDGQIDTSTGTNPNATLILPPGVHDIGLTVTSSNGSQSKTTFPVTVVKTSVMAPPKPDGGSGACQSSVTIEDVTVLGYCIQTDPAGGYVISSAQLSLNGTILVTRSGAQEIFHIKQFNHLGIDYGWQLSGAPVSVELPNTPIGTVVLGGIDLGASPIDLADHAFVPPKLNFGGLNPQLVARHRSAATDGRPVARAADAGKVLLFEFAAGQQCDPGSKGTTCCPSGAGISCAQLPGGFPIGGQVAVYANNKGQVLIDVQVNVQVPDFQATGALEIETDLQTGINLNSLQFTIPQAGLAQVFQVKDAEFTYYFPSYPDASKADSWQAKATLTFGPLAQPAIGGELDFLKGQFHYASATITLPPPGIPVYPGVFLTEFGAGVGVNPTVVSGTIGAGFGGSDGVAIELSFKYQDATSSALGFFGGQGTVKVGGQQIAQIAGDVYTDGYVDASVQVGIKEPQDSPIIQLTGSASFWDEPSSGEWQVTGSLNVTVWIISAEIDALVNNNWIAGCGQVQLGPFTAGAYAAYGWSTGHLDYDITSNCKNQLKNYQETPTTQHTGGYVGSLRGRRGLTRVGDVRGSHVLASAGGYGTITLPSGQLAEELRISSASGTPVVTIHGPGGVSFTTPTQPDQMTGRNGHYLAVLAPVPHQVVVLLEHPAAGRWAIEPVAGSPAVTNIENSAQTGPAAVRATAHPAAHGRYQLAYHVQNFVPGTSFQFVERGRDSTHVIGTARRASGTISFSPEDALGRRRSIYATLINSGGVATRSIVVGHYVAPAAIRGGRIGSVRFVRSGSLAALLTWTAAPQAREYRVVITGTDGRTVNTIVAAKTRRLALTQVLPGTRLSASVSALGGQNLLPGPAHRATLAQATRPIELLSCHRGRCAGELVSGVLSVTAAEISASLSRGGRTVATGISSDSHGTRLSLRVAHRLAAGAYTLTLSVRRGGRLHRATGKLTIR